MKKLSFTIWPVLFFLASSSGLFGQTSKSAEVKNIDAYCKTVDAVRLKGKSPELVFADVSDYNDSGKDKPNWRKFASEKTLDKFREKSETYSIAYNDTTGDRTVTNPLGKQGIYRFTSLLNRKRLSRIDGQPSLSCPASTKAWSYDATGRVLQETDEEGRITRYGRNSRGLPTSVTRGYGTLEAITTTYIYHPTLHVPSRMTEPGRITNYTWSATTGRLSRIDKIDTLVPATPNRVWTFTYTTAAAWSPI